MSGSGSAICYLFFPWKCGSTEHLLSCVGDIVKLHCGTEPDFLCYFSFFFCFVLELGQYPSLCHRHVARGCAGTTSPRVC